MEGKHILLAVSGSIAAYKSCELVRVLRQQGHTVTVALSEAALGFVAAQTFQALSGRPVLFHHRDAASGMAHIDATRLADAMVIAPATANTLAKIAHGIADNLITELAAARVCPLVVAPAMNVHMWHNPANQRNINQLQQDGIRVLYPNTGLQACGEIGEGRMLEAHELAQWLPILWSKPVLLGKRVLITLGASYEAIDPVRGITNLSSGQMGVALVRACVYAGAQVQVVYGDIRVALPVGIHRAQHALSAQAMNDAVVKSVEAGIDVFISAAAVADYRVANAADHKLKKRHGTTPHIELAQNPDILKGIASRFNAPFCVGFAAETDDLLANARAKRVQKGIPLLVANWVQQAMGTAENQITLLDDEQETALPKMSKDQAAQAIVMRLAQLLSKKQ